MAQTKTTVGSGTKITGQVYSEEDLTVEGRIEGGKLQVRGRLTVAAGGSVTVDDAEASEALVIGVFTGTLRAREAVRIHQQGRVHGDIVAPRVMFVSEPVVSATPPATQQSAAAEPAPSAPPAKAEAPAAAVATPAPSATASPTSTTMVMPHAEPPHEVPAGAAAAEGAAPAARAIPTLPTLGQRSMQRKE